MTLSHRRDVRNQVIYLIRHGNYSPIAISKTVLSTVNSGPPSCTVDRTVFEMWLGGL